MYNTKSNTEKQLMLNNVLGELMIRKSLIEPFDKERAEMYEEEIYKLKQLLNEKTNQTQRGESFGHTSNIIREA
jgi:hypothetical protein